jgi:hypothetical protein
MRENPTNATTIHSPMQDNQQLLKGVVSFYNTHQTTPTYFGS